jgi:hypothetical protein
MVILYHNKRGFINRNKNDFNKKCSNALFLGGVDSEEVKVVLDNKGMNAGCYFDSEKDVKPFVLLDPEKVETMKQSNQNLSHSSSSPMMTWKTITFGVNGEVITSLKDKTNQQPSPSSLKNSGGKLCFNLSLL